MVTPQDLFLSANIYHPMSTLAFLSCPGLWAYGHGQNHPLKPERLQRMYELLQEFGALSAPGVQVVETRIAIDEELALSHTLDDIDAVRQLSAREQYSSRVCNPGAFISAQGTTPFLRVRSNLRIFRSAVP